MRHETKFDLDQMVWGINDEMAERLVNCDCCQNTGKVMIGAVEYICPKCHGKGQHRVIDGRRWYVYGCGRVGRVNLEVYSASEREEYAGKKEIRYMLDSTGVGSGRLWDEDLVFASRQDAQNECDIRNGVLKPNDEPFATLTA